MDLTKFLSILENETLFFPTIKLLRRNDPWEGSFENATFGQYIGGTKEDEIRTRNMVFPWISELSSQQVAVNCWHMNTYESAAMWRLYLTSNEGIAIQTTFGSLMNSFDLNNSNWLKYGGNFSEQRIEIQGGKVEYRANSPADADTINRMFYKLKSFEHEKEVRVIAKLVPLIGSVYSMIENDKGKVDFDRGFSPEVQKQLDEFEGVNLPIKVNELIKNIYIAPTAPLWFTELVGKVVKRYNLDTKINPSKRLPRY